jgi:hypothetical protein
MSLQKNLCLLLATDGIYSHILNAIVTEYGISQLGDLGYYTFEVNGDEVLLTTQNRLDVEAAIGCPLLQLTGIGSCRQLSCLLAPSTVVEHIRAAVEEFESTHASA